VGEDSPSYDPAREYITLPGRLKKRLDEMDRRIATFPQRRWM
jgi:hypothetical protein